MGMLEGTLENSVSGTPKKISHEDKKAMGGITPPHQISVKTSSRSREQFEEYFAGMTKNPNYIASPFGIEEFKNFTFTKLDEMATGLSTLRADARKEID